MKYKYIVFNNLDKSIWSIDRDGYYSICMEDLYSMQGVKVVGVPLDNKNFILKLLYRLHNYGRTSKWLRWIPKKVWYPLYFDSENYKSTDNICFVVISNLEAEYLRYLKIQYPNSKIIKFFRDLVSTKQKWYDSYKATNVVDVWISYDEEEARKYNMLYYPEVESRTEIISDFSIKYDVFFAGQAKERLQQIVEVYDYLTLNGVKCYFYITNSAKDNREQREGIFYADKPMTYREMLICNSHAKCILEINQANAVGYTSRFLEAIMYNKKLLTNNQSVKNSKYYDDRFIQCYDDIRKINVDFLKNNDVVNYKYDNGFSPIGLISYLEKKLD